MISVTYNGSTYYLPEQNDRYLWAQGPGGANGLTALLTAITAVGGTIQTLTGDVTASGPGAAAATVASVGGSLAAAVHSAELAANAANSIGTLSTIVKRDASGNFQTNNVVQALASTVTAAGTTTLTVASAPTQIFTGATTQTCVFPNATTLQVGHTFKVINRSSGTVTINDNGGSLLLSATAGTVKTFALTANGTAAGTWDQS